MLKLLNAIGEYFLLLGKVAQRPQKRKVFSKILMREINDLVVNSFGLVLFTQYLLVL